MAVEQRCDRPSFSVILLKILIGQMPNFWSKAPVNVREMASLLNDRARVGYVSSHSIGFPQSSIVKVDFIQNEYSRENYARSCINPWSPSYRMAHIDAWTNGMSGLETLSLQNTMKGGLDWTVAKI